MLDIWGRKGNAGIISFQKKLKLGVWGKKSHNVGRLHPVVKKLHYDVPVLMLHIMGDRQVTGWLLCLCYAYAETPKYCGCYLFEGAMRLKSKIQHSSPGWWLQCWMSCILLLPSTVNCSRSRWVNQLLARGMALLIVLHIWWQLRYPLLPNTRKDIDSWAFTLFLLELLTPCMPFTGEADESKSVFQPGAPLPIREDLSLLSWHPSHLVRQPKRESDTFPIP